MKTYIIITLLLLTFGCTSSNNGKKIDSIALREKIHGLKTKYKLVDFSFDTERTYKPGDLSVLTKSILDKTLPEKKIQVTEELSKNGKFYIATLVNKDITFQMQTRTHSDSLSDEFMIMLFDIPVVFNSDKRYYMINPAIGLTSQEAWYFCGTEHDLKEARKEGIPLIFPGEDPEETPEFELYSQLTSLK